MVRIITKRSSRKYSSSSCPLRSDISDHNLHIDENTSTNNLLNIKHQITNLQNDLGIHKDAIENNKKQLEEIKSELKDLVKIVDNLSKESLARKEEIKNFKLSCLEMKDSLCLVIQDIDEVKDKFRSCLNNIQQPQITEENEDLTSSDDEYNLDSLSKPIEILSHRFREGIVRFEVKWLDGKSSHESATVALSNRTMCITYLNKLRTKRNARSFHMIYEKVLEWRQLYPSGYKPY